LPPLRRGFADAKWSRARYAARMQTNVSRPHFRFWPRRVPYALTKPATSLWDNLATNARRYPEKDALIFFGTRITYGELMHRSERLASFLQSVGVVAGDRVLLNMQNCPQLVIAHFAILRANAVVVPINPMNRAEELKHYILDPDARVAITTADLAPELAKASMALPAEQALHHLVVTQFTDTFDATVSGPDAPPESWHDWLCTIHPLPAMASTQVHAWADALDCKEKLGELTVGPDDLAVLPYTVEPPVCPKAACIRIQP
jgi:fatty-acyl-CoA synthase